MEIKPVSEVLSDAGFESPTLNVLLPNVDDYKAMFFQPYGDIEADEGGVRNRDQSLANKQFEAFINDVNQSGADLAVTPEYSMPWKSLATALQNGVAPAAGKLWAFGCESIKYNDLQSLANDLSGSAQLIFEELELDDKRFLDPLAYVFSSSELNGSDEGRTIVLIQFKTHPMADPDNFEVGGMQRGSKVYQFGSHNEVKLTTLICSDVFAFEDSHANAIYDRGLIVHIQLNPNPRHEKFVGCRERLLGFSGDMTEVICLNWARDVQVSFKGETAPWENNAGSAWYIKSKEYDTRDRILCQNQERGFYYTWHKTLRTNTLFLNYDPAVFLFTATKVFHLGVPGPVSLRRGPELEQRSTWDDSADEWRKQESAESGFIGIAHESVDAEDDIKLLVNNNPIAAERALALTAGRIKTGDWYNVRSLDSFAINVSEINYRITFCQDKDDDAHQFRIARLRRLSHLWTILHSIDLLPPSLKDIMNNVSMAWSDDHPHQNVIMEGDQRATTIYVGEEFSIPQIENVLKVAAENLRRSSSNDDEMRTALQRLAVWYRDENGHIKQHDPHRHVRFTDPDVESETDIARVA